MLGTEGAPQEEEGAAAPDAEEHGDAGSKRKPLGEPGDSKKARKARAEQGKARVAAACKLQFELAPAAHRIKDGRAVRLQAHGRLQRPSLLLSWVAALVEENMRGMYESGWGWDGDAKLAELASSKARYIIASLLPANADTATPAREGGESACRASEHSTRSSPSTVKRGARSSSPDAQAGSPGFWARLMGKWGSKADAGAVSTSSLADSLQEQASTVQVGGHAPRPVGMVHYRYLP